jgi:hypothetical protein
MGAHELWIDSYQGEVLGEAFFGWMADHEVDPVHKQQLEVLTRLERATKELAEPVFDRRGFDRGDSEASVAGGREFAAAAADSPWEDVMAAILPITDVFLAKYHELVELAADDVERDIALSYVAHEEALASFARRSLGQEDGEPLQRILALPHMVTATA